MARDDDTPSAASRRPSGRVVRALLASLLAGAAALALAALARASAWRAGLAAELGAWTIPLLAALWLASALTLLALGDQLRRLWRADGPPATALLLRAALWTLVACQLVVLAAPGPFSSLLARTALGLAAGVWALLVLAHQRRERRRPGPALRGLDLVLTSLCLALFGIELGLRAFALQRPSLLFVGDYTAARDRIASYRQPPGQLRFGFPMNSQGDFDEELDVAAGGEGLVVCIGDSFSLGRVPWPMHYTSVAERKLEGYRVHNRGVAAIGPPEYLWILEHEVLPLEPDAVVVALFVGNDLVFDVAAQPATGLLAQLFDRDHMLLPRLLERSRRLAEERERAEREDAGAGRLEGEDREVAAVIDTAAAAKEEFPWVEDPSLEKATFSRRTYLRIEAQRVAQTAVVSDDPYPQVFGYLEALLDVAGEVPLFFVLVPDEYQVEDDVWERAVAQQEGDPQLDRDQPQRVLKAWFDERGVAVLDLLPAFRAVPPMKDGRRHLYHLQDTHWNARGNRLAGLELARFLEEQLAR